MMLRKFRALAMACALISLIPLQSFATQTPGGQAGSVTDQKSRYTRLMVTGDATVKVQPDTAILSIAVVTQAKQADEAQQQNASLSEAVMRAVKTAAGTGAEVKTSGYSIEPQRIYREAQPPTISGYEVRNSVLVTLSDLKRVGNVIDAASGAGANNIDGISFTLRNDQQAKSQALTDATKEAMTKAKALASALGGRLVRIAEVQEQGFVRPPIPLQSAEYGRATAMAKATPIEVGTLDVNSQVQLVVEVDINQ
jgi:hypothetical protein